MFGRRRAFDRNNNDDQNATGYQEKTVFSTDFGSPEMNNYQNGYAQANGYMPSGGYTQANGYAQSSMGGTATEVAGERPRVFASRKHSDMFVYEYSDRVEWYLKTDKEMYLFDTVKK